MEEVKPRRSEVESWLMNQIALSTEKPVDTLDPDLPFASLGLDSTTAVAMSGDLEDQFGFELDPTLIFEFPSVTRLLNHLEAEGVLAV
ncbi:hypothetical protein COW36_03725 [bacterium (Candidatus Blackallbacteria) CG17_big_fil_post_rev_8_21_14_2_50_48_46]|uniref:Carrier domain-containing protein n=1 Tax=bacterium (Candidatus Blackallbacteria) CG17_big_fil_post_rev_8_21_14_2_50_48_46 TaxID=2014261 RepID=A0A2M7G8H1_9BACT|nr:MAG: hypothetical protein COW64_20895 [bacterium (Candidatus Blackallbacteria) CG18_big_fil_WC_8_21_14_2_50_49_26]PIW18410.1 MAG: hypothetical protein COW36_03725 [bacterium (Candidatus Blackallbacteria) CG17_big_fil_post_rev_8_21_14_2_50_48_46]PIW50569.1 MAG: hypothetical protein COW20_02150 [bacterium (Candidatus Blackallbacteria) CG13_big_fil_rev_8_21_14_2_50_49_14]